MEITYNIDNIYNTILIIFGGFFIKHYFLMIKIKLVLIVNT